MSCEPWRPCGASAPATAWTLAASSAANNVAHALHACRVPNRVKAKPDEPDGYAVRRPGKSESAAASGTWAAGGIGGDYLEASNASLMTVEKPDASRTSDPGPA